MTQIPENMRPDSIGYNKVSKKADKAEPVPVPQKEQVPENAKILDSNPAAFLGKTQVKKSRYDFSSFNAETVNNMKKDLRFMGENPELVAESDKMFDRAYKNAQKAGETDPYAKAAVVQAEYINEFR